jgi:dTMP kinase
MGQFSFFGSGIPRVDPQELKGKLVVIEGADGVGRTTQICLLKQWLETEGHAVLTTRMTRSGKRLRRAKNGTTLGRLTMALFYATDLADRLEHEIIPALKAGFVVLADRYIFTLIARALVRGIDPDWIREAYSFALRPDRVFYLRARVDDLVTRVLQQGAFEYWESGIDLHLGDDMYESFVEYQQRMLGQFDKMVEDYGFTVIDASRSISEVFAYLKDRVAELLSPAPLMASDASGRLKQLRNGTAAPDFLRIEPSENRLSKIHSGPEDSVVELSATHSDRRAVGE